MCRVLCTCSGLFKHSSNLPEPHHYRDSKVCRVLSHEFGVVRPYRTFSVYIVTGETRSAGCLCTSSGWFKHIDPPRTFSNHIITKIARCVEFCHMSSGWFDCTEPTSLQGKQGMQGAYALVRGGSSTSNLIESEIARFVEFCHMSSGGFDCTEPSLSTSVTGATRYGGCCALVRGGSSTSNLPEPHHYRDSKVCRVLSHQFGVVRPHKTVSVWCGGCLCTSSGVVQAHRTSSNLLEPHHYKDSKVCSVLSHEFGVVRLYRTFSIYIVTEIARCAGCLCTCSGWFKNIEPHRTLSNHIITEIARYLEFCFMSSGVVRLHLTFSIYIVAGGNKVCRVLMHLFGVVQAHRTSSNLPEPHH